jgi:hypothetical protein
MPTAFCNRDFTHRVTAGLIRGSSGREPEAYTYSSRHLNFFIAL